MRVNVLDTPVKMGSNEDDDDVDLSEISPNFHIAFGFSSTLSLGSHSEAFRIHTQLIHIRYQPMVPTFPPLLTTRTSELTCSCPKQYAFVLDKVPGSIPVEFRFRI